MIFDSHSHTEFSSDSEMKAVEAIETAKKLGIGMVFTEHYDYDYILDKSPTDVKINLYPLPSSISLLSLTTSNLFSRKSFM